MAPEEARAPSLPPPGQELGEGLPHPPSEGGGLPEPPFLGGEVPGGFPGYHERQRLELCALHALNNLLQRPWIGKDAMDRICRGPLERLCLSPVLGLLLNVPSRVTIGGWSLPLSRPHWVGVRQWGGTFYNLDSKLARPLPIGGEEQLRSFLRSLLSSGLSELFLVVPRDVEAAGTWLSPE
ncbi:josephin-2-like [Myiozetetes cayanensis]|uniref:josephin-2-like n=1 Tax=Myiozetetes cayanensis TaxID=478635 RepID=UPI002160ABA0|nr:josephin-2-like [Myiozetetes cayanensis]